MKRVLIRIAAWTSAGFLVSLGWGLYFASTYKGIAVGPIAHGLAQLTQLTAAVVSYLNPGSPLSLTWVAVTNAATYALLGSVFEFVRGHHRSLRLSN